MITETLIPHPWWADRLVSALAIFMGALLLFLVEPLIAKMILPWFGGAAGVWIVCLLFFQAALLGGYLYAHLLTTRVDSAWQWRVHLLLLLVSLFFLPIIPSEGWKPAGGEMNFITHRDHRLMRRVNRWRPPRWVRIWMICATPAFWGPPAPVGHSTEFAPPTLFLKSSLWVPR